ncbi:ABC transporter substrate-binding protein [Paraburkholderia aromaticivorans]|uniref:ABC transporter substrate-binding protein n=1 Tax=Paraburkholderia aromaticivorans TaxID=2026199 RepID=UPI001456084B|nr:ABC transporter substrate-binding protein [Paraburkholderia aromaticivorans]
MNRFHRSIVSSVLATLIASPSAQAAEFVIGSHDSLTGSTARVGSGMNEGIQLAAEYFNRKYPEHKFKVVTIDDEAQPAKAVAAIEKLTSEGVLAFSAGYGTNIIAPASETAGRTGLVYITSGGVGEGLTHRGLKTFFRITNAPGYARAFVGTLTQAGVKSVSILYSTKESPSTLANDLNTALPATGIKVTLHPYDPSTQDFKPLVNKVKLQDRPDAMLMLGYENDYIAILRAARLLKPELKAIMAPWGIATTDMRKEFPDLVANVYGTTFTPDPPMYRTAEGQEFASLYRDRYKKEPDYLVQFGFVQTELLFEAIMRSYKAGTLKQKNGIADELRKTDRETLVGHVRFDATGDFDQFAYRMGQHQNGKIAIVWPKEYATANMNYPAVPW